MTTEIIPKVFWDIDNVKNHIEQQLDLDYLKACEANIQVTCEDTAKHALSMALQSRKLEQTLEKSRSEITKPHVDYQRAVNKLVKDVNSKLQEMEDSLRIKIETWMSEQAENPFFNLEEIKVDDGMIYKQKSWDFDITDETKLPREYLTADLNAIEKAVKAGTRNIPGVKVTHKEKMIMRIKN